MNKLLTILILLLIPTVSFAQVTAPNGGTGLTTYTQGDIIYAGTTNPIRFTKLNIGSNGTCLGVSGGLPTYISCGSGSSAYPFTTATTYGTLSSSTSTPLWLKGIPFSLFASSTSIIDYASTTMVSATTASTTNLIISSAISAILQTMSDGTVSTYGGSSCTNQFVRSLSALGIATCATVSSGDVSLANLSATDSTLTFSGTYDGSTARTIGLNLSNSNVWTAASTTFNGGLTAINATTTNATTTTLSLGSFNGPLQANNGRVTATTSIGFLYGGTGLTSALDDTTLISSGSAWVATAVTNCTDTGGNHLNYTAGSNAFSCGTSSSGGSGSGTDKFATSSQIGVTGLTNIYPNTATTFSFGTTTPWSNNLVTFATSTGQNLTLTNGGLTASQFNIRTGTEVTWFSTSTALTGATGTPAAITINHTGMPYVSIATTTTFGILNLGLNPNTTNASSTISGPRTEFDILDSGGTRRCAYWDNSGAFVTASGACNN
jgi:hypothetical protein